MLAGGRGPAWMAKPYSFDLRERVVAAVEKGGMSRRQAAAHFAVGISTVINWVRRFRETGSVAPGQMGGHKPKAIRDAHHDWLVARIREKDFTLRGMRLKAKVPQRRWKTMTFIAALRRDRIDAPWLIDGPINGERFRLYVET